MVKFSIQWTAFVCKLWQRCCACREFSDLFQCVHTFSLYLPLCVSARVSHAPHCAGEMCNVSTDFSACAADVAVLRPWLCSFSGYRWTEGRALLFVHSCSQWNENPAKHTSLHSYAIFVELCLEMYTPMYRSISRLVHAVFFKAFFATWLTLLTSSIQSSFLLILSQI